MTNKWDAFNFGSPAPEPGMSEPGGTQSLESQFGMLRDDINARLQKSEAALNELKSRFDKASSQPQSALAGTTSSGKGGGTPIESGSGIFDGKVAISESGEEVDPNKEYIDDVEQARLDKEAALTNIPTIDFSNINTDFSLGNFSK